MGDTASEPGAKDPFVLDDEDQSTPEEEQVTHNCTTHGTTLIHWLA